MLKYICINHGEQRVFFFNLKSSEMSLLAFSASVETLMLWVYGHYKLLVLSVRGTSLDVGIWESIDVRFWRLKSVPALKGLMVNWDRILVQVIIYRRLWIGRDGHLDQFNRDLYENTAPGHDSAWTVHIDKSFQITTRIINKLLLKGSELSIVPRSFVWPIYHVYILCFQVQSHESSLFSSYFKNGIK